MKLKKTIGNYTVVITCDDFQKLQAESLMKKLEELNARGPALENGTIVRFGWSDLKLVARGEELIVMEPDFGGNALRDYKPQVTETILVLTEQLSFNGKLNLDAHPAEYYKKIIISKGCLAKNNIFLDRQLVEDDENDSGWFIGESNGEAPPDEDNYEAIHVYDCFRLRRSLMKVFALPPGYLVVFDGNEIEAILDSESQNIWNKVDANN